MLLQEIVEVISFTDTDLLSGALDTFNEYGIVKGDMLPFLSIVFEQAPEHLIKKLADVGFKGDLQLSKLGNIPSKNSYLVYDNARFTHEEAMQWCEAS